MQAEVGSLTINGGWLIFAALVAVWVALVVENRTRRLGALLEAAQQEAADAVIKLKLAESEAEANSRAGLGQLAAAVEQQEGATAPAEAATVDARERG
jgi:hypothetical protein